jgi:hypothetical protein
MTVLNTGKIKALIAEMKSGEELARRAFQLLSKRPDAEEYFDVISEAGFFAPARVPNPIPDPDNPGYLQIPYWDALDYLVAVAHRAVDTHNSALMQKVLNVIRAISRFEVEAKAAIANHAVYWRFADVLGMMPVNEVTIDDIDLVPRWFGTGSNSGMIAASLGKELVPNLLASDSQQDMHKAARLLFNLTAVEPNKHGRVDTVVEEYWLKELLDKYSEQFGAKVGKEAAPVLEGRLREADELEPDFGSWVGRPAIENHPQNHAHDTGVNALISGCRDVLLAWVDTGDPAAVTHVVELLSDKVAIVQRIAIYAVNARFQMLVQALDTLIDKKFLDREYNHEIYNLWNDRFAEFDQPHKQKLFDLIQGLTLPVPEDYEAPDRTLKRLKRKWLMPISGKGLAAADQALAVLNADATLGAVDPHPDLQSYIESFSGPGSSPYTASELISFALTGMLVDKLNEFVEVDSWHGPSYGGLTGALKDAAKTDVALFMSLLPAMRETHVTYQHAVIEGMKAKWEATPEPSTDVDWPVIWQQFFEFIEKAITSDEFWAGAQKQLSDMTADWRWFITIAADTMRAGTFADKHAYPKEYLPAGLRVIKVLLTKAVEKDKFRFDDAMTQAINTTKGRVIESLVSHSLRACRVADQDTGSHAAAWKEVEPLFDDELAKCADANFEFSTSMGCYVANLAFMSPEWLKANISAIFSPDHENNFVCAVEGFSYSPVHRDIYRMLSELGVVDKVLRMQLPGRHSRESVIERLALSYLWGDEKLDGPHMQYLFDTGADADLALIANYFWRSKGAELTAEQKTAIVAFWRKCLDQMAPREGKVYKIYPALARVSVFLTAIDAADRARLVYIAQRVKDVFDINVLVTELDRLATGIPEAEAVAEVLDALASPGKRFADYEGKLLPLAKKLEGLGQKARVLQIADKLRDLPGFTEYAADLAQ